jgi:hypothetical protein
LLTLVLLAGAGSAMKGFLRLMHTPLGYDPHHVMSVGIPLHENSYTTWAVRGAYFEQLRARVAGKPRCDDGGDLQQRYAAAEWMEYAV